MSFSELRNQSAVLKALEDEHLEFLSSIYEEHELTEDSVVFDEDDEADAFYIIGMGRVGLEVPVPTGEPMLLETLGNGDLVGLSWASEPYRWKWRARALSPTRVYKFDAETVRERCADDPSLGAQLYLSIAEAAMMRLQTARVRLLDLYPGAPG